MLNERRKSYIHVFFTWGLNKENIYMVCQYPWWWVIKNELGSRQMIQCIKCLLDKMRTRVWILALV